jgi:hypothetical protein
MTDSEILRREIASMLDHPSVFMGGPSQQNMRLAERIIRHLESGHIAACEVKRAMDNERVEAAAKALGEWNAPNTGWTCVSEERREVLREQARVVLAAAECLRRRREIVDY